MTEPRDKSAKFADLLLTYRFEIFLIAGMLIGAAAIGSTWGWHDGLVFLAGGALGAPLVRRLRP